MLRVKPPSGLGGFAGHAETTADANALASWIPQLVGALSGKPGGRKSQLFPVVQLCKAL